MQKKQFGRSMIEMLGVLAIIAVLSIGGLLGYRRAVNNHQANVILDDVNRFAFVILERSGLALGEVIPKGDFVESGVYTLEGYQDIEPEQFSITVFDVPRGVCEALLPKAVVEYKVRVNPSANEQGKLYDTLNTDLCLDNNFMVFYFGDTTGVCNVPDDNGPTPCTTNADCCGGEFCVYVSATEIDKIGNGCGQCESIEYYDPEWAILSDGQKWLHSRRKTMNGWTAYSFCEALGLRMTNRAELNCSGRDLNSSCAATSPISELKQIWGDNGRWHWLDDCRGVWKNLAGDLIDSACTVKVGSGGMAISGGNMGSSKLYTLCH